MRMSTVTETISATMVKELREKTGAPMMDCRSALVEAQGSMEEAVVVLRKKGNGFGGQEGQPHRQRRCCRHLYPCRRQNRRID